MQPREIGWRLSDAAWRRLWARRRVTTWASLECPDGLRPGRAFASPLPDAAGDELPTEVVQSVLEAADRLLEGRWDVLGSNRPDITDPDWFLDVVTGVRAPDRDLAFSVNHRDESQVGNIKSLWEVSRHHHLTLLASAFWLSGDERYAEMVDAQLRSWWDRNPFLTGVHWTSGIEIAIRLISWTWIRRLLDGWQGATALFEDNPQALWQLAWHQEFLERFPSRGSSSNNHVVAEACGLFVASCAFPWFDRSAGWREDSRRLLERELDRNTFPSGVNRELATDYHRFVTELGLVAAVEADAADWPLSPETWTILGRSLDVAAALLDVTGEPPRQGDGDEGRALVVDGPEGNPWTQLLAIGEGLVGRAPWWPETGPCLEAFALGSLARSHPEVVHRSIRPDRFDDAGIALLRTSQGTEPEIWCRCDGGPHGFLSIAAHAHADALSVEVRHDGVEILVDPGTYCYHGERQWRDYFRSTLAHNTVQVAGLDQSVSGGPFLWTRHASSRDSMTNLDGSSHSQSLTWSGVHDGYQRLATSVTHRRSARLDVSGSRLVVTDRVETSGALEVVLAWHVGPAVTVELGQDSARLRWDGRNSPGAATLQLPKSLSWSVHGGETEPVLGWYSPRFGEKVPSPTLLGRGLARSSTVLVTTLQFDAG